MEIAKKYYGIDVSEASLQISTQNTDGTWSDFRIDNTIKEIEGWVTNLNMEEIHFVFEYTGTYSNRLAYCLTLLSGQFSILNPKQSKGFADTLKKVAKTDRQDARILYLYGQKMNPEITVLASVELTQKRQKYKHLAILKADKHAFSNRLHALSYDPNADQTVVKSTQEVIDFLELQIMSIQQEVFTIGEDDFKRIYELMTSVVGIGDASAQALIVATNGFNDFDNAKQLAKFIGVSPTDRQSGSSVKGRGKITKSGVGYVRSVLYVAAHSAKKYNNVCKDIYTRLRAKGKSHKVAIIAVVHKLIIQLFAVVKSNTVFDNNFTVAK
jgi:transposase